MSRYTDNNSAGNAGGGGRSAASRRPGQAEEDDYSERSLGSSVRRQQANTNAHTNAHTNSHTNPHPHPQAVLQRGGGTHNRPWMSDEAAPSASAYTGTSASRYSNDSSTASTGTGAATGRLPVAVASHAHARTLTSQQQTKSQQEQSQSQSAQADQLVQAYLRRRSRDEEDTEQETAVANMNASTSSVTSSGSAGRLSYQSSKQLPSSTTAIANSSSSSTASSSYARYLQQKQQQQGQQQQGQQQQGQGPAAPDTQSRSTGRQSPAYDTLLASPVSGAKTKVGQHPRQHLPPRGQQQQQQHEPTANNAAGVVSMSPLPTGSTGPSSHTVETSRELRARRLRNESRSDSRSRAERATETATATAAPVDTNPTRLPPDQQQQQQHAAGTAGAHYQANPPLVEKYLTRSKMMEGTAQVPQTVTAEQVLSTSTTSYPLSGSTSTYPPTGSTSNSRPPVVAVAAQATATAVPVPSRSSVPAAAAKSQSLGRPQLTVDTSTSTPTSTTTTTTIAAPLSRNVNEYLAQRNAQKHSTTNSKSNHSASPRPMSALSSSGHTSTTRTTTTSAASSPSKEQSSPSALTAEGSESVDDDMESESDGEESESEENGAEWSLRATVVSAVDFPSSVVPNLPFSPVLKVALVPLASLKENPQGQDAAADETRRRELAASIESKGLAYVKGARIRCTSSKILSKRDNGSVEFHEEMRWDRITSPTEMVLVVELSARAVMTPVNAKESPVVKKAQQNSGSPGMASPGYSGSDTGSDTGMAKLGNMLMKGMHRQTSGVAEMETANAAAAVAKLLVEGEDPKSGAEAGTGPLFDSKATSSKSISGNQSETDVKLRSRKKSRKKGKMTQDIRLGSQIVPLWKLPLEKAINGDQSARIEQWIELDALHGAFTSGTDGQRSPSSSKIRNPSILMEICFSSFERMDDSEDDMDEDDDSDPKADINASFSKRASMKIRSQIKDEKPQDEMKDEEPVLEPGVVDFLCVVGARDIGNQTSDDGSKGWVNSTPECCVLEQFPPTDDYHVKNGRMVVLPNKVEWFCFPEGIKLWRGKRPPSHEDLNLKRFSASSPPNVATSYAAFDACLGCTTSFAWFVIASNSDSYGSDSEKTYGAVIRFFVPAPTGIDSTQDDFAQSVMGGKSSDDDNGADRRRLWVPIGICLTSSLPIVGVMETMLLRLCKELGSTPGSVTTESVAASSKNMIYEDLELAIFNFQRPIRGIVQCSIPFLNGERMHIGLPPRTGLPPLPHGNAIVAVCRLVGADGLNFLLAAFLTECKIVLHANDVANVSMVAEVITALLYPFSWSLPYVPVLPAEMMEFIEAPLSYLLGVPSCNVKLVDPSVFEDVVVIDLDSDFSSVGYFEGRRTESSRAKAPTPLPATTANNISKSVYRMLRAQEEVEEAIGNSRSFPRMEPESLAEREFRLAVALEVSSLIRGYDDNLVFAAASQPVFNVDKFLQTAPALFEQQRGASTSVNPNTGQSGRVLSPRSKRFLSQLVNCQHFHQLLETLDSDQSALFHEIMGVLKTDGKRNKSQLSDHFSAPEGNRTIDQLNQYMQKREDKIPTYRVKRSVKESNGVATADVLVLRDLLQPIVIPGQSTESTTGGQEAAEGVKSLSLEYLVELEKNPWRYNKLFNIELRESDQPNAEKVKLREAIGDRKYLSWKAATDRRRFDPDDLSIGSDDSGSGASGAALDLKGLLTLTDDAPSEASDSAQQRIADAKDRDALRRCLEKAWAKGNSFSEAFFDKGRNLVTEAEVALRNPSAQDFLLTILKKRLRAESQAPESDQEDPKSSRRSSQSISSKLEPAAFEVLVRLGCAMLDACMEDKRYEPAYSFLKHTAGLYTNAPEGSDYSIVYMTGRIGQHPIFADLGVWEKVKDLHLSAHHDEKEGEKRKAGAQEVQAMDKDDAEYEAAKATLYEMLGYGIPAEELARFVSRVSENNGWFQSERGKTLLLLARRLSVRREQGADSSHPATTSDIEMISPKAQTKPTPQTDSINTGTPKPTGANSLAFVDDDGKERWIEVGWCHPAAKSSRRLLTADKSRRPGTQPEQKFTTPGSKSSGYTKRSAVTSLAYLGSSVVVTGGLDGGVFMARKVRDSGVDAAGQENFGIRGVHLDWGSSGSRYTAGSSSTSLDGEYGVGSVTCLAATRGAEHHYAEPGSSGRPAKDVVGPLDDEDLLNAMEGNRVVAGTTCGDLRVWSVKDVFAAVFYTNGGDTPNQHEGRIFHRGGEGASSGFIGGRRKPATDFAAGSSLTRLKFSLRGRALSGHRGGVSCIDVPSNVYRPDSIVSGGADGLIKLWSLRAPGASVGRRNEMDKGTTQMLTPNASDSMSPRTKAARNGDALSILSGHGGRILCVKTAWHGDRLLSGGADRTVRVWDLAGSGGKCLHTLSGHFGWVTAVHYWGPNTIISASTDRSIALWDARVRSSPLFTLRHHHAPVSDLLVGSRTDPIMVSSASDGTIAAWDFRHLSGAEGSEAPVVAAAAPTEAANIASEPKKVRQCKVVRYPAAKLYMHDFCKRRQVYGPVSLARGPSRKSKTVLVVGGDAVMREWDFNTGKIVAEHATGHCDTVSSFRALQGDKFLDTQLESTGDGADQSTSGTITTSWDGTVRMRTLARN